MDAKVRLSSSVQTLQSNVRTLSEASLQAQIAQLFEVALRSTAGDLDGASLEPLVATADPRFGDYQCNNAMALFKHSKQQGGKDGWKSPRDVGQAIKDALPAEAADLFEEVNVAPQGFITVKLKTVWMEEQIGQLFEHELQLSSSNPQRIVIDYSSPNIAKEMHVGHLRSTILGDTIANLFTYLGHDVVRLNHVGDWGTQFGMLLEYMRRKDALDGEASSMVSDLQKFYRSAKQAFDEDEDFRKSAQTNVVELQGGSDWARTAWNRICEASRKEFDLVYQRLNIQGLQERGESFYNNMLPDVVEDLQRKDLITESDGALCVFTNISETPLIVQKADGGFGYDSTDCAAVRHRVQEEKAQRVIYVIDNGQELHMRMVFSAAEKAGWLEGGQKRLDFMGFGLVQGQDGKKFKTRSGDVVRLRDLLDEAASRSEAELRRRAEAAEREITAEKEEQLKKDAESIGVAAVKYFDLRQNRNSDYRFSYDQMLDPKGNTAVYVLYAYARIAGVLRRAENNVASLSPSDLALTEPSERALALRVMRLPEVLTQLEDDLLPSRLIDHIYSLATDFTTFYTECFVIGSEQEKSRLVLLEVVRRQLLLCLGFLQIKPFEQL